MVRAAFSVSVSVSVIDVVPCPYKQAAGGRHQFIHPQDEGTVEAVRGGLLPCIEFWS